MRRRDDNGKEATYLFTMLLENERFPKRFALSSDVSDVRDKTLAYVVESVKRVLGTAEIFAEGNKAMLQMGALLVSASSDAWIEFLLKSHCLSATPLSGERCRR